MKKIEVGEIIEKLIREYKLKESVLIIYTDQGEMQERVRELQ